MASASVDALAQLAQSARAVRVANSATAPRSAVHRAVVLRIGAQVEDAGAPQEQPDAQQGVPRVPSRRRVRCARHRECEPTGLETTSRPIGPLDDPRHKFSTSRPVRGGAGKATCFASVVERGAREKSVPSFDPCDPMCKAMQAGYLCGRTTYDLEKDLWE